MIVIQWQNQWGRVSQQLFLNWGKVDEKCRKRRYLFFIGSTVKNSFKWCCMHMRTRHIFFELCHNLQPSSCKNTHSKIDASRRGICAGKSLDRGKVSILLVQSSSNCKIVLKNIFDCSKQPSPKLFDEYTCGTLPLVQIFTWLFRKGPENA